VRRRLDLDYRVVHSLDLLLEAFAVRSAVYVGEEACPHAEEFDGNDFCATHFLGYVSGEPAGTLRVRFFGDFVKFERLAVRSEHRGLGLARSMVAGAKDYCARKGFTKALAHSRTDRVSFWATHGFQIEAGAIPFVFSDNSYVEMWSPIAASHAAINSQSGAYVVIRPEGDWDRPGVLERSAGRPARDLQPRGRHVA
jgi:predicted GNAT family N-acyltransferase